MNVNIQSVKFDADKKLIDFVNAKIIKLEKFAERAVAAEVIMKLDKDHEKGNKVVTVKLAMPGGDLVADCRSKSFEESVDESVDALRRQLEKHKDRYAK